MRWVLVALVTDEYRAQEKIRQWTLLRWRFQSWERRARLGEAQEEMLDGSSLSTNAFCFQNAIKEKIVEAIVLMIYFRCLVMSIRAMHSLISRLGIATKCVEATEGCWFLATDQRIGEEFLFSSQHRLHSDLEDRLVIRHWLLDRFGIPSNWDRNCLLMWHSLSVL